MDSRISARGLFAALGGWRTREPAYEALADGIRVLCLDGRLVADTALPAERELATALSVSRTTVAAAYRSLRESGHVTSLRGSGTMTLPIGGRSTLLAAAAPGQIDLQQASPPAWPGLAGVFAHVAADSSGLVARTGYDVYGNPALRQAIADRYSDRGIPTTADEIMVTSGGQSAIHLIAGVLVARGDRVLIETPTYPHAADAFRRAGARLVGIPVDTTNGWDLERGTQAFGRTLPSLAYLMPDFQNPTGRSMSVDEWKAIEAAAERAGTVLVLDETTADLDIDRGDRPPHRGGTLHGESSIVRIGSFGKTVWGGLRVGWIRAESAVIRRLITARPVYDLGTPEFEQAVALAVLPHMPEVLGQRSAFLRAGRDALTNALGERLPQWVVPPTAGGVSLWVALGAPLSSTLVLAARDEGLFLSAGPRFSVDGGHERHLRVPFTAPPEQLRTAVDLLERAWTRTVAGVPSRSRDYLEAVV